MEIIPQTGVPRMLNSGEKWTQRPKVTLAIDDIKGIIIEIREQDGCEPITVVNPFTLPNNVSEQEVIDTTTLV